MDSDYGRYGLLGVAESEMMKDRFARSYVTAIRASTALGLQDALCFLSFSLAYLGNM